MRNPWPDEVELMRVRVGQFGSSYQERQGLFIRATEIEQVRMIVHDGLVDNITRWEHVSVSIKRLTRSGMQDKIPGWSVMCKVKELFWNTEECVVQFHPPRSVYKNDNPTVLHLWKKIGHDFPMPPLELV